ncbi:MAG: hypothetical protein FWG31_01090 [Oscillospiraceae bacterium]|nr:hypothetical protein [Oscillospiraceae bacterium]
MKRKITPFILTLALVIQMMTLMPLQANAALPFSGGGTGTEQDPYIIMNQTDLYSMQHYSGSYFELGDDISLTGYWTRIDGTNYSATLNGKNYTIYNLKVSSSYSCGLFGEVYRLNVSNLILDSVYVDSNSNYTGAIVGNARHLRMENCHVKNAGIYNTSSSSNNGRYTGGLVGDAGAYSSSNYSVYIADCTFQGTVSGNGSWVGGIAGRAQNPSGTGTVMERCGVLAGSSVTGGSSYTGGLIGEAAGTVQESFSRANVRGIGETGGLVGFLGTNGKVINCYSTGDVFGGNHVGGIVGDMGSTATYRLVENCYSSGWIEGGWAAGANTGSGTGGIVGRAGGSTYVRYNVALNAYVEKRTSTSDSGRVWGSGSPGYSGNRARSDMTLYRGGTNVTVSDGGNQGTAYAHSHFQNNPNAYPGWSISYKDEKAGTVWVVNPHSSNNPNIYPTLAWEYESITEVNFLSAPDYVAKGDVFQFSIRSYPSDADVTLTFDQPGNVNITNTAISYSGGYRITDFTVEAVVSGYVTCTASIPGAKATRMVTVIEVEIVPFTPLPMSFQQMTYQSFTGNLTVQQITWEMKNESFATIHPDTGQAVFMMVGAFLDVRVKLEFAEISQPLYSPWLTLIC